METAHALHLVSLAQLFSTNRFSSIHHAGGTTTALLIPSTRKAKRVHPQAGRGFGVSIPDEKSSRPKEAESSKNDESEEDEIPDVVMNRMLKRILFSVGTPIASSIGLVFLFGFLEEHNIWKVPLWLPLLTILVGFGSSGLGIAYGSLSTSWDPEKEGSLLGWEQAQKNWPVLWKDENGRS